MTNKQIYSADIARTNTLGTSWNLLDALLIAMTSLTIIVLGSYLINITSDTIVSPKQVDLFDSFYYVASITALEGIAILAGIFLVGRLRQKSSISHLGLVKVDRKWYLIALLSSLILIPLIGLIALGIQKIMGVPLYNPQLDVLLPKNFSWFGAMATLIFGGILVPVAEELFFRGILYKAIKNRFGILFGAIVSSVIFGALHGDFSVAGATFVMGLVLVTFYEKSRSIYPSILIHITNNSLKLLVLYAMFGLGIDIPTI